MGKVLFWVIVIIAGLLIARILARHHEKTKVAAPQPKQASRRGAPPIKQPESMVRCAHCGIHMPRSDAVLTDGQTWCSAEHAKLGTRQ
ncbi:MAG TPA: PP0621 family protein [Eoetvoesiella sp.]